MGGDFAAGYLVRGIRCHKRGVFVMKHIHIDASGICGLIMLSVVAVILSIPFWFLVLLIIDLVAMLNGG